MGAVDILRDALIGNPPSPTKQPSREGVLAAFTMIAQNLSGALAGIVYYDTGAARAADNTRPVGTIGKAANESDYYRYTATGWVVDNSVYEGIADLAASQIAVVDTRVNRDGIVLATPALIGSNPNEWAVSLPDGVTLPDLGSIRFPAPAAPTGPVFITTDQFGRQPLNITRGFAYPPGLISTASFLMLTHFNAGNQWFVTGNSDSAEYRTRHPGVLLPDPDNASTASHWYFVSTVGYDQADGSDFSFFAPTTNTGPVDITINGQFTGRLRKSAANDLSSGDIGQNMLVSASWPGGGQNSYFVTATGIPQDGGGDPADTGVVIPVDSGLFTQTDYPAASTVTKTDRSLRIVRPIADAENNRYAVPAARDRCRLKARWYEIDVRYGDEHVRVAPSAPLVLVDGAVAAIGVTSVGNPTIDLIQTIRVPLGNIAQQLVEFVFPYEQPVSITGRRASKGAVFSAATARPSNLLVTPGDSLTQGFSVDSVADQWAYLLAKDIGFRLVNHGYGGRRLEAADGAVYGAEGGAITTYMILANDVTAHTELADVTSRLNAFWAGFFGAHPQGNNAKLLMISQTWMEAGDGGVPTTPTGPQYRTTMQNAVAAAVGTYPNLRYKSGLDLTDGAGTTTDGTHLKSSTSVNQFYPRLKTHLQSLGWI